MTWPHIVADVVLVAMAVYASVMAWRSMGKLERIIDKTRVALVSMSPDGTHPALYHQGWCDARMTVLVKTREIYEAEL